MLQYRRVAKVAADASVEAKIETDGQQKKFFLLFLGWRRKKREKKQKKSVRIKYFFQGSAVRNPFVTLSSPNGETHLLVRPNLEHN